MEYTNLIIPDEISEGESYVFVSYSHEDVEAAQEIIKIFKDYSIRFWYDRSINHGVGYDNEIGSRIVNCTQFIILMSPNADASSYVKNELGMAHRYGKNILVIYLEDTKLSYGNDLIVGGLQAIYVKNYGAKKEELAKEICGAISKDAFKTEQAEDDSQLSEIPEELKLIAKAVYDGMTEFEQDFVYKGGNDGVKAVYEVLPKLHDSVEKMIAFSEEHGDLDSDVDLIVKTIVINYQNTVNCLRKFAVTGDATTDEAKDSLFSADQSMVAVRQAAKKLM